MLVLLFCSVSATGLAWVQNGSGVSDRIIFDILEANQARRLSLLQTTRPQVFSKEGDSLAIWLSHVFPGLSMSGLLFCFAVRGRFDGISASAFGKAGNLGRFRRC